MNEHKDILLVFMDIDYLRRINNDLAERQEMRLLWRLQMH